MPRLEAYDTALLPEPAGGYTVRVPALPEAITYGADRAEALANAAEVIELVLEVRIADGEPIPDDVVPITETLTIAA